MTVFCCLLSNFIRQNVTKWRNNRLLVGVWPAKMQPEYSFVTIYNGFVVTEKPIVPDTSESDSETSENDRIAERRQLLMLGAAGLPMMLTLKASAQEVLVSQLTCAIKLPKRLRILVDCDGRAWVGTKNIKYTNGKGFKVADIVKFKDDATYAFPAGDVPNYWLPDNCPIEECSNGGGDDDDDDGFDYETASAELDDLMRTSLPSQADGIVLASARMGDDDDDDDEDDCDEDWIDSGYAFYELSKNSTILPVDHTSGTGWSPQANTQGLFIALSLVYESRHGDAPGWPGISCIVSIISYFGTQN